MSRIISPPRLQSQIAAVIAACGSAPAEADKVAANLVLANLCGHDSHGVGMVPRYVDAVLEGGLQPNAGARVATDIGTLLALDGQRGYGQVVGEQAMQMGIARARQHGSCIMTLGNSHHLGRIGHFAEMAVDAGLVSLHFVNVLSRPVVAPFGGGDGRFGTNPCCIGVPLAGQPPFILDFATSRVAQGKMRVAHNKGERVPEGYLIDEQGRPTTDPGVVVVPQGNGLFGALMAFGEHKGYGLAVACELLGGALSGGGTWHRPASVRAGPPPADAASSGGREAREAASVGASHARTVLNGMLTVLVDPARLGTQQAFEQEATAFVDWLRDGPAGAGHDRVRIAGEPEREARALRERQGIALDDATWEEIVAAGAKVGCSVAA